MGNIKTNFQISSSILETAKGYAEKAQLHVQEIKSGQLDMTGWARVADETPESLIKSIEDVADEIRAKSSVFVVIGIGGSYLGTRAVDEFVLGSGFKKGKLGEPVIVYAGFNMSGTYHKALYESLKDEEITICQFSKSGTTVEPSLAFSELKNILFEKYGEEEANARIYAVTDKEKGVLRAEVDEKGYKAFVIPNDFGGRYSVMSPIGLLPMAVAGIDIREVFKGVKDASTGAVLEAAKEHACVRRALQDFDKVVEGIGFFEPNLFYFGQWMVQLYGESEGKDGKGVWPSALNFSTDLHSMGQFLQEGNQIFYETILEIVKPNDDIKIGDAVETPYAGKFVNDYNNAAMRGVIAAHRSVDVPIIEIIIPDTSAYTFGQLVYFFEMTCGVTALLMGVNPFNQPGVEAYKAEMRKIIG
ncbi:MAG: glucose-6-phosphate isomerase [Clostridiales Family XIII bacterium]|jgi:glucose-6-phosphate isomerase|nr:glucose-6-phosphate isomerase [Clostridiales Family XIII bacterium]